MIERRRHGRRLTVSAQIETAFIYPGKPWQNGADESFNGKFRDYHLSLQWFRNRIRRRSASNNGAALQRGATRFESGVLDADPVQRNIWPTLMEGAAGADAGSR